MWCILVLSQSHDMSMGISAHQMFSMVRGSRAMSGTKLMPNWALANAHLGTIEVNTQFGCHPHWALVNTKLGFLTPNSET